MLVIGILVDFIETGNCYQNTIIMIYVVCICECIVIICLLYRVM